MTTTVPGLHAVKPSRTVRAVRSERPERPERPELLIDLSDDPTEYPDGEPMCRDPVENEIALKLQPLVARHQAERGIVCFTGSDAFIYYRKGDNKACVSPDLYTLPGLPPSARPRKLPGSKDEGCWKTWLLGFVPNFGLEVKAFGNPRKDELQSPKRHDACGTKELIIFDPFASRRRRPRKRFCVMRRDESGSLVTVLETNEDRVYSQEFDAYIVAEGEGDESLLRLGLGPNGERLLPFDSELIEMASQRADEQARRADQEARMRQEEARMRQEEARMRQEEALRADEQARRADEAKRVADEATRRTAELEAEIARLRAATNQGPKRGAKGNKSPFK